MSIKKNLSEAIKRIKRERQISYAEMASELGISKSSLETYINGTRNPRIDTLELLAKKFNISVAELVCGPLPDWERVEAVVRAAKEFGGLSPEQQERGLRLFMELAVLFSEGPQK